MDVSCYGSGHPGGRVIGLDGARLRGDVKIVFLMKTRAAALNHQGVEGCQH